MKNKIAVVTGASSRLGRYLVELLSSENYVVYAGVNTKRKEKLFSLKNVYEVSLDVTNVVEVDRLVKLIKTKHEVLHVLINNAALSLLGDFENSDISNFERMIEVNQVGPLRMIKQFLPVMQKNGKIINIASLNSVLPLPRYPFYVSTKYALLGLSRSLYYELYGKVFVTSLAPGAISFPNDERKKVSVGARDKMPILNVIFPFTKPKDVCDAVMKIINSQNPPSQVFVGMDSRLVSFLLKILPGVIVDKAILFVWQRK